MFSKKLASRNASILIESLLSVVILSVSITLIIQSMTTSLRMVSLGPHYTKAFLLAENELSDILMNRKDVSQIDGEGSFPEPNAQYQYSVNFEEVDEFENLDNINITVQWQMAQNDRSLILETFVLKQNEK